MTRLQLENISIYRSMSASEPFLSGVNLKVDNQQILGLLGPNASGKTSLVRAIAGFIPPKDPGPMLRTRRFDVSWGRERRRASGLVLIDGEDVTHVPPGNRGLSLVPQNLALYPDKNVLQNIMFPLRVQGVHRVEAQRQAIDMAQRLGLDSVLSNLPSEISGGQQQRVAIGRALISQPKIVLLDEPFASLDILIKRDMLALFGPMLRERGASAVFVSHDPEEVSHLCDLVAFVSDGVLHQVATPQEAFRAPATLFVGRMFSGFSNVLRGEFLADGRFLVHGTSSILTLNGCREVTTSTHVGRACWLAARPRAFMLAEMTSKEAGIPGVITGVYNSSGMDHVRLEIGTDLSVTCLVGGRHMSVVGKSAKILLRPAAEDDIRFFSDDRCTKLN